MPYRSTKTYGHEIGLSCCFRQWRAESHCQFFHGYALKVHLEFEAQDLDDTNWVVDFGGLKQVKNFLEVNFDHKTVVAIDDPKLDDITLLEQLGLAQVIVIRDVGCEAFAEYIYHGVLAIIRMKYGDRVHLNSVTVSEHGANSATYYQKAPWNEA